MHRKNNEVERRGIVCWRKEKKCYFTSEKEEERKVNRVSKKLKIINTIQFSCD
jgi:hypothetical protein